MKHLPASPFSQLAKLMRMGKRGRESARLCPQRPHFEFNGQHLWGMREASSPRDHETKALEEVQGGGGPRLCV